MPSAFASTPEAATTGRRAAFLVALLAGGLGCAGSARQALLTPGACAVSRADLAAPDTLIFAITSPLDPARVTRPADATERALLGLMYEPLLRIDCRGAPHPALALDWTSLNHATEVQTLTLRDDARYWSGEAVDVRAVAEQLRQTTLGSRLRAEPLDARRLTITASRVSPGAHPSILELSQHAYAHVGSGRIGRWPMGTGPYSPAPASNGQETVLVPEANLRAQHIQLHVHTGGDERDALDSGADLLVTTHIQTTAYARARSGFDVVPLPWDRRYVYVSASARSASTPALAATLASDVVPAEARSVARPDSWFNTNACRELPSATSFVPPRRTARVAYEDSDPVARAVAERLVGLAGHGSEVGGTLPLGQDFGDIATLRQPARATPMARDDLLVSLSAGQELGWVLALPISVHGGCPGDGGALAAAHWATPEMIVPLIDTRAHLIIRRGSANIVLGGDGRIEILARGDTP